MQRLTRHVSVIWDDESQAQYYYNYYHSYI